MLNNVIFSDRFNFIICISILSVICVTAYFTASPIADLTATSAAVANSPQIILDAGHGGFDGGAVAFDGTVEKDINLQICLALSDFLKSNGYEVIMTRSTDASTDNVEADKISTRKRSDLKNRLKLMSDYPEAVFVSVHLNKFTTSAAFGSQVFYNGKVNGSKLG